MRAEPFGYSTACISENVMVTLYTDGLLMFRVVLERLIVPLGGTMNREKLKLWS